MHPTHNRQTCSPSVQDRCPGLQQSARRIIIDSVWIVNQWDNDHQQQPTCLPTVRTCRPRPTMRTRAYLQAYRSMLTEIHHPLYARTYQYRIYIIVAVYFCSRLGCSANCSDCVKFDADEQHGPSNVTTLSSQPPDSTAIVWDCRKTVRCWCI